MPMIISKDDVPNAQYNLVKYNDENVMMSVIPNGVVLMYVDKDENLFVPWGEIVEYAALSPNKKGVEEQPKEPEKKSGVREVKK